MWSTLRGLTVLFVANVLILTLIPCRASSLPIAAIKRAPDRDTHISNPYLMDETLTFNVAFALGRPNVARSLRAVLDILLAPILLALFCAWAWMTYRTTVVQFAATISCKPFLPLSLFALADVFFPGVLAAPVALTQQLSTLRFATLLGVGTTTNLDANDVRRTTSSAPSRGGPSNPVASAPRARSQWAQFRGSLGMRGGTTRRTGTPPIGFTSPV